MGNAKKEDLAEPAWKKLEDALVAAFTNPTQTSNVQDLVSVALGKVRIQLDDSMLDELDVEPAAVSLPAAAASSAEGASGMEVTAKEKDDKTRHASPLQGRESKSQKLVVGDTPALEAEQGTAGVQG